MYGTNKQHFMGFFSGNSCLFAREKNDGSNCQVPPLDDFIGLWRGCMYNSSESLLLFHLGLGMICIVGGSWSRSAVHQWFYPVWIFLHKLYLANASMVMIMLVWCKTVTKNILSSVSKSLGDKFNCKKISGGAGVIKLNVFCGFSIIYFFFHKKGTTTLLQSRQISVWLLE